MMINRIIAICLCLLSRAAFCGIDHDLNAFYRGLGYQSNVTAPTAFQDQAAGYYTGGSVFFAQSSQTVSVGFR